MPMPKPSARISRIHAKGFRLGEEVSETATPLFMVSTVVSVGSRTHPSAGVSGHRLAGVSTSGVVSTSELTGGAFAPEHMEGATESAVGVSAARFEFDLGHRRQFAGIDRRQVNSAELEQIDPQPRPVPPERFDSMTAQVFADLVDGVGAATDAQLFDVPRGLIERGQRITPPSF